MILLLSDRRAILQAISSGLYQFPLLPYVKILTPQLEASNVILCCCRSIELKLSRHQHILISRATYRWRYLICVFFLNMLRPGLNSSCSGTPGIYGPIQDVCNLRRTSFSSQPLIYSRLRGYSQQLMVRGWLTLVSALNSI